MIPFTKMHGLGNDFVVIDNRKGDVPALAWSKIADRHFGIGCDQVILLENPTQTLPLKGEGREGTNIFMRIYNADGGEVESCGNASRCVAWLIAQEHTASFPSPLKGEGEGKKISPHPALSPEGRGRIGIETLAGVIEADVKGNMVTVDMGAPLTQWNKIPLAQESDTLHLNIANDMLSDPAAVSMGNPHMVFFVPDCNAVPLHILGPMLEKHPLFPARANVGVAQILPPSSLPPLAGGGEVGGILLRVWERGAGLTLACGTGACAALVAAHLRGLTGRKAKVQLPGGELLIEWRKSDNHVLMTGPVAVSFEGALDENFMAPKG